MGDDQDGGAGVGVGAEGLPDGVGGALVEGGGGAVRDEEIGGGTQGGGDRGALDLARGVLFRQQVHHLARVVRGGARSVEGHGSVGGGYAPELLADGPVRAEGVDAVLGDVTDAAVDHHLAGDSCRRGQTTGQGVGDHRLAGAGAAEQRGDPAVGHP
ncbi:hypothetical protein NN3_45550 [Nocardia neocaledoniensis NBRC 108232]|uniref:Uncharacterized protein n=1 Tax=Nocardia neocaledoniensis TaxID=236511 RepID=A0A317NDL1_9NOCA|nr:hypothetical protein DFR69_10717 [Nocardia neocaledoniensis]GEM33548.1 hypothetical protein NN3_45550 [Nocardia neocaledoniensis NBRC 108232]